MADVADMVESVNISLLLLDIHFKTDTEHQEYSTRTVDY